MSGAPTVLGSITIFLKLLLTTMEDKSPAKFRPSIAIVVILVVTIILTKIINFCSFVLLLFLVLQSLCIYIYENSFVFLSVPNTFSNSTIKSNQILLANNIKLRVNM